jgi:hypothetical protein
MNEIDQIKIEIRPLIPNALINESMSIEEKFQNTTLRSIIKLQHNLIFQIIKNHFKITKFKFENLSVEKKKQFIENTLLKDVALQNELKGIIIGFFTKEEFDDYSKSTNNINKRIFGIIKERINSNLGELK